MLIIAMHENDNKKDTDQTVPIPSLMIRWHRCILTSTPDAYRGASRQAPSTIQPSITSTRLLATWKFFTLAAGWQCQRLQVRIIKLINVMVLVLKFMVWNQDLTLGTREITNRWLTSLAISEFNKNKSDALVSMTLCLYALGPTMPDCNKHWFGKHIDCCGSGDGWVVICTSLSHRYFGWSCIVRWCRHQYAGHLDCTHTQDRVPYLCNESNEIIYAIVVSGSSTLSSVKSIYRPG